MDTQNCSSLNIKLESDVLADVIETYPMEESKEDLKVILENEMVCRLCMQAVASDATSFQKLDIDTLHKYIPKVELNATKEPIMCKVCVDSLHTQPNYSINFINVKEEINDISDDNAVETLPSIKCEEVEIKSEENCSDTPLKTEPTSECRSKCVKTTNDSMVKGKRKQNGTKNKYSGLKRGNSSEDRIHKCDLCEYKSDQIRNLARHKRRHKQRPTQNISEKHMFKCNLCEYESDQIRNLARHQHRHKNVSEDQMYKCDSCDYRTRRRDCLTRHLLRHKNVSEKQMHHCHLCDYETDRKENLIRHQLKHKEQMYKCDSCDFTTNYKHRLTYHQLKHKDIPENEMYKCDLCDYKTVQKFNFMRHQIKHIDIPEDQMYRCESCDYKTKYKTNLSYHQLTHKDVTERPMYRCDSCDFKTVCKHYFARHMRKVHLRKSHV